MLYKLYLDESGTPDPITPQASFPFFILSGIVIKGDDQSEKLKIWADRIKFKYWGKLGIVFHSREIGRRENNFSILRDPTIEQNFYKDLVSFLNGNGIKCIMIAVDKQKAQAAGWNKKAIYQDSADKMIQLFIEYLQNNNGNGRIIIESAGTQKDIIFYKNYIHYLADGFPALGLDHKAMKRLLTSISFVSKNNYDIESQIADLLAYPAGFKCLVNVGKKNFIANSYEEKMCNVLMNKLITTGANRSFVTIP